MVKLHTSATDLLLAGYAPLCRKETSATIVLAHALDQSEFECEQLKALLQGFQQEEPVGTEGHSQPVIDWPSPGQNFWLTLWKKSGSTATHSDLQLVVSCLSWRLGDYPVFLWSSNEPGSTRDATLHHHFELITSALLAVVPPQRVFSVFGRKDLILAFERAWTSRTHIAREPNPFYTALLTFCTKESFRRSGTQIPRSDRLRLAESKDVDSIGVLCKEFADTSVNIPPHLTSMSRLSQL